MTDQELPVVVAKNPSRSGVQGPTNLIGAALTSAVARAVNAASLAPLVAEDLLRHLHLKLHECYMAKRRTGSILGNLRNIFTGTNPDFVEISGSHLRQTLELLAVDDHGAINVYEPYLLRADVARQAHDLLGAQLGVEPETLRKGLD